MTSNSRSPKRKQLDGETANDAVLYNLVKNNKVNPQPSIEVTPDVALKRKQLIDNTADDPTPPAPAKKPKPDPEASTTVTPKPATKHGSIPTAKALSVKSILVPRGERTRANVGQKDDSLLRMVCDCSLTGKVTELHFRKIPHSMIDWNSAYHISKINAWRNQIYGRAGQKAKSVTMWHELEELWFELYFHLSIAEARSRGILLPTAKQIRDAFNETFVGQVLQGKHGDDLAVRTERQSNAFASKFNRMFPQLRERLNKCVFGKSGDVFVPKISFGMMHRYKAMKAKLAAKGIKNKSEDSENTEEWQQFLAHFTDDKDAEAKQETKEGTKEMEAKEEDAVAALICLANSPANAEEIASPTATHYTATDRSMMTPEPSRSTRTSFSQSSDGRHTPYTLHTAYDHIQRIPSYEDITRNASEIHGFSNVPCSPADNEKVAHCPYFKTYSVQLEDQILSSRNMWPTLADDSQRL